MNAIRITVIAVVGLVLSDVSLAAKKLPAEYSDKALVKVLRDDGYRYVEITDDRVIKIKNDAQADYGVGSRLRLFRDRVSAASQ